MGDGVVRTQLFVNRSRLIGVMVVAVLVKSNRARRGQRPCCLQGRRGGGRRGRRRKFEILPMNGFQPFDPPCAFVLGEDVERLAQEAVLFDESPVLLRLRLRLASDAGRERQRIQEGDCFGQRDERRASFPFGR